jgi:hypothetical protein
LDALFAYNSPLGAHVSDDAVTLTLWAPTTQVISFKLATLGNLVLLICQLFQTTTLPDFPCCFAKEVTGVVQVFDSG